VPLQQTEASSFELLWISAYLYTTKHWEGQIRAVKDRKLHSIVYKILLVFLISFGEIPSVCRCMLSWQSLHNFLCQFAVNFVLIIDSQESTIKLCLWCKFKFTYIWIACGHDVICHKPAFSCDIWWRIYINRLFKKGAKQEIRFWNPIKSFDDLVTMTKLCGKICMILRIEICGL
jgi:hypothetical protein